MVLPQSMMTEWFWSGTLYAFARVCNLRCKDDVQLENRMIQSGNKGKTVTIKLKYSDFTQQTRSKTINDYLQTKEEIFPIIEELLYQKEIEKSVRLLGISITNLYRDNLLPKENFSVQLKFDF